MGFFLWLMGTLKNANNDTKTANGIQSANLCIQDDNGAGKVLQKHFWIPDRAENDSDFWSATK